MLENTRQRFKDNGFNFTTCIRATLQPPTGFVLVFSSNPSDATRKLPKWAVLSKRTKWQASWLYGCRDCICFGRNTLFHSNSPIRTFRDFIHKAPE